MVEAEAVVAAEAAEAEAVVAAEAAEAAEARQTTTAMQATGRRSRRVRCANPERVRAGRHRERPRRRAGRPGATVESALERRTRCAGGECERCGRAGDRAGRAGVDRRLRRWRLPGDRPRRACGRPVDVARQVGRADIERVLTGRKARVGSRRVAGRPGSGVDPALEPGAELLGGERERGVRRGDRPGRRRGDGGVRCDNVRSRRLREVAPGERHLSRPCRRRRKRTSSRRERRMTAVRDRTDSSQSSFCATSNSES